MFCIHPPSPARPNCELAAAAGLTEKLDMAVMAMEWWSGWMEEKRWMERHNLSQPNKTKHPLPWARFCDQLHHFLHYQIHISVFSNWKCCLFSAKIAHYKRHPPLDVVKRTLWCTRCTETLNAYFYSNNEGYFFFQSGKLIFRNYFLPLTSEEQGLPWAWSAVLPFAHTSTEESDQNSKLDFTATHTPSELPWNGDNWTEKSLPWLLTYLQKQLVLSIKKWAQFDLETINSETCSSDIREPLLFLLKDQFWPEKSDVGYQPLQHPL